MRWKVLILESLAAAFAGLGLVLFVILGLYGSLRVVATHELSLVLVSAIPLIAMFFAGFFVYRRTARRRKLQTALAVLLTFFMTMAAFALGSVLTPRLQLPRMPVPLGAR